MNSDQLQGDEGAYSEEDFKPSQGTVPMAKFRGQHGRRNDGDKKYPGKNGRNGRSGGGRR